jgi:fatty acid desaturase
MNHRPEENYDPSTWKDHAGVKLGVIRYCIDNFIRSSKEAIRIGKNHPRIFKKWIFYSIIGNLACMTLVIYKPIAAITLFYFIPLLMIIVTYFETYFHHAGLETKNQTESCYNYLGRFYNFVTFNLGYHTAHHMNPSLHWSKLPAFHATIERNIPDICTIKSRMEFLCISEDKRILNNKKFLHYILR